MNEIALIGNGYWGSKIKNYIPYKFDLKYVADSKFDKKKIWNDNDVKSVIIVTPIEYHYEHAKEALNHDKNVFIEKPISLKAGEAEELIELADKKNLKLGVEYTQTFSPSVKHALGIINKIGDLEYIEMSTKHLGRFMNQDVFWLLASHHLSILGMIIPLSGTTFKKYEHMHWRKNICTTGSLTFINDNLNVSGRIDVSTNFPGKDMHFTLYGSKGTIKYTPLDDRTTLSMVLYEKEYAQLPPELTKASHNFVYDEKNNLIRSIEYFDDLLNNRVESNALLARDITYIIERSSKT